MNAGLILPPLTSRTAWPVHPPTGSASQACTTRSVSSSQNSAGHVRRRSTASHPTDAHAALPGRQPQADGIRLGHTIRDSVEGGESLLENAPDCAAGRVTELIEQCRNSAVPLPVDTPS